MARRDDLHFPVRRALEKDGWKITHDPLELELRGAKLQADLGAEVLSYIKTCAEPSSVMKLLCGASSASKNTFAAFYVVCKSFRCDLFS